MAYLNQVQLIGNLGGEPKYQEFSNGGKVTELRIATTRKGFKTSDGKEIPDRTEWHNIVLHDGLANVARQYLHKGDCIYIQGELRTRMYEKDGQKRYVTEIHANNMQMLGGNKKEDGSNMQTTQSQEYQPQSQGQGNNEDLPF